MVAVLVTGGSGYIGSALISHLLEISWINKVINYDSNPGLDQSKNEKFIQIIGDILNYKQLVSVFREHNVKAVIHLAACSSITACNEDPYLASLINGVGTTNIVAAMKKTGCQNIIYASTSSVYGNNPSPPYTEAMEPTPVSVYGITKLSGEKAIINGNSGNYLIFRLFNVVGTSGISSIDERLTDMGFDRIFSALMSGKITIYGHDYPTTDGTCERDYISLKDVCQAFINGIIHLFHDMQETKCIINIGSGVPTSVFSIITAWNLVSSRIILNEKGYEQCRRLNPISHTWGPRREGDPARVYADNQQAHTILRGWKPEKKIEDIIRDLTIDIKHGI